MGAPINVTKTRSRSSGGLGTHAFATRRQLLVQLAPALQSSDDTLGEDIASKLTMPDFNRTFIGFFF